MRLPKFIQNIVLKPTPLSSLSVMAFFTVMFLVIPIGTGLVDLEQLRACEASWQCHFSAPEFYVLIILTGLTILSAYYSIELLRIIITRDK